jgi:serine/threonine-protein kinase RsbW
MSTEKFNLQVPSDIGVLDQVMSWFDSIQPSNIPIKVWLQSKLAIAEAFTNAVRHAHRNVEGKLMVDMEVAFTDTSLEIRIWDFGPVFDLASKIASLSNEVDQSSGGGRGLLILHKICDRLEYTRNPDQRNCLLMAKDF